jgi:hypothetical protein
MACNRMLAPLLAVGLALGASGCVRQVRELTRAEAAALEAVRARVVENRAAMARSLSDLGRLSEAALAETDALSSGVAKAQLLEAMRSPWTEGAGESAATRREVALYHLYALVDAERKLRQARLAERQTALAGVAAAYDRLAALTDAAAAAEAEILRYLEQPRGARIGEAVDGFLGQARAFADVLARSEDPEMRLLADQVTRGEDAVRKAKELIEVTIEKASQLKDKR